ncbi:2,4'-dihydroxyacetophenone dioxygenase family protein [Acidovorax sp. 22279]|uniref:2,4'-dihydroxyacetophenone dioxygenase family protein n=1 Tax=Acidovorax sp. 22279 TaxID=3453900 RepID=UPI003F863502
MQHSLPEEFWRDIAPIANVFKPDAKPEVHIANAATDDGRFYVPISETVSSRPLWISPSENKWADILRAEGPGVINRHYHPHEVFAFTLSGKWSYLEHEWTAEAGDFVYETPGESHTLVAHHHPAPMRVFFIVKGPLIWLDEAGKSVGHFDVHDYIELARAHYQKVGLGAAYVDTLFR